MMSTRVGGPFAAKASSGRRKREARPALMPELKKVRRRIRGG
jgi:hypothetical protein